MQVIVGGADRFVSQIVSHMAQIHVVVSHSRARLRVYLTHLVGGCFIDPALIEALVRRRPPLPDYIYVLNILHGMGIHPRLDYIDQENRLAGASDFDDFAARVAWTLGELTQDELARLRAWVEGAGSLAAAAGPPVQWAFISWEKK